MAHGDYDCCACCDCKMAYAGADARTKEDLCASCAVDLMKQGVEARSGLELAEWINKSPSTEVLAVLKAVGFSVCYYGSAVDDAAKAKGWKD